MKLLAILQSLSILAMFGCYVWRARTDDRMAKYFADFCMIAAFAIAIGSAIRFFVEFVR